MKHAMVVILANPPVAAAIFVVLVASGVSVASAQVPPADPPPGAAGDDAARPGSPGPNADLVPPDNGQPIGRQPRRAPEAVPARPAPPAPPAPIARPPIDFPEALRIPTGWLLPAAALYSSSSVDTGGGVTSDHRVGLGDVAEFGVATTDQVRERTLPGDKPARIQPYLLASFRLGVAEHRLFDAQPGVTLGFRKSFERNHAGFKTRIAELTLVASKHLGSRAAVHAGAAVWDASLQATTSDDAPEVTLHGHGYRHQIRAFGGIEVSPLPRSSILVDLGWAPDFCYQCVGATGQIELRPELSWGVRYEVARSLRLESGVRVPDIGNVNLLDAQIFGQITITSYVLRDAVDRLK